MEREEPELQQEQERKEPEKNTKERDLLLGTKRPRGTGRKKIEIKKIEKKDYLNTTFTKRRNGLFKKADELCNLCGAEVAIVAFSPYERPYVFGNPDADTIFDRFLNEQEKGNTSSNMDVDKDDSAPYSDVEGVVDEEKKKGFWWEEPVEGLGLKELEEHKVKLMELKSTVINKLEEFRVENKTLKDFLSTRFS